MLNAIHALEEKSFQRNDQHSLNIVMYARMRLINILNENNQSDIDYNEILNHESNHDILTLIFELVRKVPRYSPFRKELLEILSELMNSNLPLLNSSEYTERLILTGILQNENPEETQIQELAKAGQISALFCNHLLRLNIANLREFLNFTEDGLNYLDFGRAHVKLLKELIKKYHINLLKEDELSSIFILRKHQKISPLLFKFLLIQKVYSLKSLVRLTEEDFNDEANKYIRSLEKNVIMSFFMEIERLKDQMKEFQFTFKNSEG